MITKRHKNREYTYIISVPTHRVALPVGVKYSPFIQAHELHRLKYLLGKYSIVYRRGGVYSFFWPRHLGDNANNEVVRGGKGRILEGNQARELAGRPKSLIPELLAALARSNLLTSKRAAIIRICKQTLPRKSREGATFGQNRKIAPRRN